MPRAAGDRASSPRRLALPLTSGLALWAFAHYVLSLPGAFDSDNGTFHTWALATSWVITSCGAVLALVCAYRLARRVEAHLLTRNHTPETPETQPSASTGGWRSSPATVLIAGSVLLTAASELLWVFVSPGLGMSSWAIGIFTVVGSVVAPAALTAGVYLALRRLEDHLAGHRRDKAPTAAGGPHASGLTSPYVRT
ncbi:hypothetical protein [uncultured Pseudokineococcus sp.]|uniref:hypothetical protein n=1 Tax=uncultured Pseudokineococcus sp. TaxID=1642928 RepID=UPI002636150A|nr:hypothetical protein [uncultured Pseudokineococcus sp.]